MSKQTLTGISTLLYHELEEQRHRLAMMNHLYKSINYQSEHYKNLSASTIIQHEIEIINMEKHQQKRVEQFLEKFPDDVLYMAIDDPEIKLQWPDRY